MKINPAINKIVAPGAGPKKFALSANFFLI